jgi:hypothetical protein
VQQRILAHRHAQFGADVGRGFARPRVVAADESPEPQPQRLQPLAGQPRLLMPLRVQPVADLVCHGVVPVVDAVADQVDVVDAGGLRRGGRRRGRGGGEAGQQDDERQIAAARTTQSARRPAGFDQEASACSNSITRASLAVSPR